MPGAGWCSWQRYRCAIACNDSTSTDCFNERLIRDTADAMASSGLAKAGYEYVACDTRHPGFDTACNAMRGAKAVSCCQAQCWHDPRCDAINVDEADGHCIKRACGTANISHPDTTQPHFDSYHLAEAPAKGNAVAPGFTFKLTDAGFNFNTRVSVRELFSDEELGIHVGEFATAEAIPLHGTQLLTYAPLYPPHAEL